MIDFDKWTEIFYTLRKNKLRTFLTVFGVSWGIFMLLIMLGAGKGLENSVIDDFQGFATNRIVMWTQRTTVPYKGFPEGRHFNMNLSDMEALKNNVPEIDMIAPRIEAGAWEGNNVIRGTEAGAFSIHGDFPEIFEINPMKLQQGRFINQFDINDKRKVALIGWQVYETLFEADENPIGEYITIQGVYFKIIGVFRPQREQDEREAQSIYIPFTTFRLVYNWGDVVGWVAITAKGDIPASLVQKKAIEVLKPRHSISPLDEHAFGAWNMQEEFEKMSGLFFGIRTLIWIVGIGTLLAGIIGISNIMLIVIKERTNEIGIKRAIGASPWNIINQIITESVFLTFIAGYVGLVAGVAVVSLAGDIEFDAFKNPDVSFRIAMYAIVILVVFGTLAGIIPAKRAVNIKPIDALRDE